MARSKLLDLIDLAQENSSAKRRELLREMTDLFFSVHAPQTEPEIALFDTVLVQLSNDMEEAVRAELGVRFAAEPTAPKGLVRKLANDNISVAEPILATSRVLSEADLLDVVRTQGQDHLRAVSKREAVSEAISDVIVERGDDQTLGVLLGNEGAQLSRGASERAVDRAVRNKDLHEAVINRRDLPPDLLNEMYFVAEARLRQRILEQNAAIDPALLEAALSKGRTRVAAEDGALPADYDEAEAYITELRNAGELSPKVLARFLRSGGMTHFLVALGQLADIDFHTARSIVEKKELDALGVVCKAADLDRALFLTYTVVLLGQDGDAMAKAHEYGKMYAALPRETAMRTLRFWRLRRQEGSLAA